MLFANRRIISTYFLLWKNSWCTLNTFTPNKTYAVLFLTLQLRLEKVASLTWGCIDSKCQGWNGLESGKSSLVQVLLINALQCCHLSSLIRQRAILVFQFLTLVARITGGGGETMLLSFRNACRISWGVDSGGLQGSLSPCFFSKLLEEAGVSHA